jgi:hypothetical protein
MQKTTVVTALFTAIVFAGVGYVAGSKSAKPLLIEHPHHGKSCKGGDCDITIMFACASNVCEPYADPEVVVVDTGKKIKFTIDNSTSYLFNPTDGIKFDSNYFSCSPQGAQKKYDCDVTIPNGTPLGFYKYSIHVVGLTTVDPWVVNY